MSALDEKPIAQTADEYRRVARLNPNALNPDGTLRSLFEQFAEVQMRRIADDRYRAPGPYVLAFDGGFTGIPKLSGKPIVLSGRSLNHVIKKHGADIEILSKLPQEIGECFLAYENPESADKITFILDAKSSGGHDVITVLRADLNMNQIEVGSVRSVHGRERGLLLDSMSRSLELGRNFYLNEKSGAWLEIQKHIPDESGVAKEVLKRLNELDYSRADQPDGCERHHSDETAPSKATNREISRELERLSGSQFPRDYFNLGQDEIIRPPRCVGKSSRARAEAVPKALSSAPEPSHSPTQKQSKSKLPGPDRAAKHGTPAADEKALTAQVKAQATPSRTQTPKVVK